jgi:DNA-binding transcriptional regulator YhcF (GntR family)
LHLKRKSKDRSAEQNIRTKIRTKEKRQCKGGQIMQINFESEKPIFVQLADWLSDSIISGAIKEGEQIPSTTEMSVSLKINPATALKGVNMLVDKGIIYKKRGLGMFVSEGAVEKLKKERQSEFFGEYIKKMLDEAAKLGLSKKDIIEMIERG